MGNHRFVFVRHLWIRRKVLDRPERKEKEYIRMRRDFGAAQRMVHRGRVLHTEEDPDEMPFLQGP